jgi:hypothetical protein
MVVHICTDKSRHYPPEVSSNHHDPSGSRLNTPTVKLKDYTLVVEDRINENMIGFGIHPNQCSPIFWGNCGFLTQPFA